MKKLFLFATLCFGMFNTFALDSLSINNSVTDFNYPKTIFKIPFSHFFINSIQGDFEIFSNSQARSLNFSPRVTLIDNLKERLYGAGMEVGIRKYTFEPLSKRRKTVTTAYFYYTVGYNYYNLTQKKSLNAEADSQNFSSETESQGGKGYIHKVNAHIGFGLQFLMKEMFSVDVNLGGGGGVSFSSKEVKTYEDKFMNIGNIGVYPKISIAFGMISKR